MTSIKITLKNKIINVDIERYSHDAHLISINTIDEHIMITGLEDWELEKIQKAIKKEGGEEHWTYVISVKIETYPNLTIGSNIVINVIFVLILKNYSEWKENGRNK